MFALIDGREARRRARVWSGIVIAGLVVLGACGGTEPANTASTGGQTTTDDTSPAAPTTPVVDATNGPLRVVPGANYFVDQSGQSVVLVGSHTWESLQDYGQTASPGAPFDYEGYLDFLASNSHNFFRLWAWEQTMGGPWTTDVQPIGPSPFVRSGPDVALDGEPKFDVTQFNDEYFARLRSRVEAARDRGIYVSVMLFNGWSIDDKESGPGNACPGHPFNEANNVNGIDVDRNDDGRCEEAHTLADDAVTDVQEAYVAKVVETVGDLDNVLYEISNESPSDSTEWQYHMIRYVKDLESSRPVQHPVGMTVEFPNGDNDDVFDSPADWVSPNTEGGYQTDPPAATGDKVVILDTDHLWGVGGDRSWVWKSVTRGYSVVYMDCYDFSYDVCVGSPRDPVRLSVVANLGQVRRISSVLDFGAMRPDPQIASTGYALVGRDGDRADYLVYLPDGGSVTVDLTGVEGPLDVEWLDPETGTSTTASAVADGQPQEFEAPVDGDAVLVLRSTG